MSAVHDPLCWHPQHPHEGICYGNLARARADERERLYSAAKADSGAMLGIVLAAEQIEAEVRERIAQEIEAASEQEACTCHKRYAAIARGGAQ